MTRLPLEAIKVLDLTRWVAGPFGTALLGDLGAEVIKVESLKGDQTRQTAPFVDGESAYFLSMNRNKKGVALDFRHPKGREVLKRLALSCDVLVENFKVGVAEQMGLGYETLSREHPRLIYGAVTAFGLTGPYRDRAGLDQIAQGMGGLTSVTGFGKDSRVRVGIPMSDIITAMFSALAIVAAIREREVTGKGRRVEVSLLDSTIGVMCFQAQKYLSLGEVAEPQGNNHPLLSPCGLFQTRNGQMNICVSSNEHWRAFCELLGAQELLEDPRFADNTLRRQNREELTPLIEEYLRRYTKEELTEMLSKAGIPAGPLYTMDETFQDPHVQARNVVERVLHPTLGEVPLVRSPLRMEGMEQSVRLAPPLLGQHTREVLASLGYTPEEIQQMLDEGAALQADVPSPQEEP